MKRAALRHLVQGSGLAWLRWQLLPHALYCFNYHRIGNPSHTRFDRGVFSCSQDNFREQVELLSERFIVIGVAQLLWLNNNHGRSLGTKPLAMITFDDGYKDNFELAFPVLKSVGVRATFFLPTAFVGSDRIPWWDEIAWMLRSASVPRICLSGSNETFDVGHDVSEATIIRVLRLAKRRSTLPMFDQLEEIRAACAPLTSSDAGLSGEPLFMTWNDARALQAAGMDIGSHTHTHEILSHLDEASQHSELATSKRVMESELRVPVHAIAYPVGSTAAYTGETCRIAKDTGYALGFTFAHHANALPLVNPFEIGRFAADGDRSGSSMRTSIVFPRL